MLANDESLDERARRRLRELRVERGLTLQEVAAAASIDVSTLSRLEAGKRRLALDHLPALASALGVSTDEIIRAGPARDPRIKTKPQRRHQLTMWPLTERSPAGGPHAYKILISAKRTKPPSPLPIHEGHDWLYVLDGRLRLLLGEQDLTIEPGEAVEFSTWTPHWFGAIDGPVELLAILGPQGEKIHLHA